MKRSRKVGPRNPVTTIEIGGTGKVGAGVFGRRGWLLAVLAVKRS